MSKPDLKKATIVILAICLLTSTVLSVNASAISKKAPVKAAQTAEIGGRQIARFENMLNHNYLFEDEFSSDRDVIEKSIISLNSYVDDNNEIDKSVVLGFIKNMYGLSVDENSAVYSFAPAGAGKFAVIACGYSQVKHSNISAVFEEGRYVVSSDMTVSPHDGDAYTVKVKTIFVENKESSFGYNIVGAYISNENNA